VRILGIDLGERRVGVAVWDDPELPARPLTTLEVTPETIVARIAELATREQATELVVGLPLRLDGREGTASRRARRLAAALGTATGLHVVLQDERLTTSQAHTHRLMAGAKGRAGVDARAAAILLQTFVDTRMAAWRRDEPDEL
jgi:putative Holliday junction resolvase